MKRISVIVPTYNEDEGLEEFLKQFEKQTLPRGNFELIVVDGDSTDGTREIAGVHADKVIIQQSKGIGGARNDGFRAAGAPIVATTDADVRLPQTWLERILEDFEDSDVVAVCGPDGPIENDSKSKLVFSKQRTTASSSGRVATRRRRHSPGGAGSTPTSYNHGRWSG
ncbi:MAG: glycosyltransferase family 2 protein, partial [Candidatus Thermoplasmatota archaeon]|nr:glycosyltransferase family 2 protein [Candidatus Thermoplasmatota archaeon]